MNEITKAISDLMFEQNISIMEMGRRTGLHRSTITHYLIHPEKMPLGALKKILDAMNVDWNFFWQEVVIYD